MKLFHLSDLHIGKQLLGYSLRANQEAVLEQIINETERHSPDAVLICGDIYDKTVPSAEAYEIFDRFLIRLSEFSKNIPVLIIAGNHDSPERLQYASSFMEKYNIHISVLPPQNEKQYLKKVVLKDEYGSVNFYLLPFTKPGYVRHMCKEREIDGYQSAVRFLLERESIDYSSRNVLLSHQFYTYGGKKPKTCESEQAMIYVGGLDQIDISVIEKFDYAALGHLHGAQKVGKQFIRYCGTPFKYSVSEQNHKKGITAVHLGAKGTVPETGYIPLHGLQDVRHESGRLEDILAKADENNRHDFISVTLTDDLEPYHFREKLEEVYDYLLEVKIDNIRTKQKLEGEEEKISVLNPFESFCQFYELLRSTPMTGQEEKVMRRIVERAREIEEA